MAQRGESPKFLDLMGDLHMLADAMGKTFRKESAA